MIKEFFKDLIKINGIEGISIYSIDNALVDIWVNPGFNSKLMEEISLDYFQLFSVLDLSVKNYKEIVITHEMGQIYARILPDLLLVIVVKPLVEIALIRLIVNVQIPELLNSRQFLKKLRKVGSRNFLDKKYLDNTEKEYLKKLGL